MVSINFPSSLTCHHFKISSSLVLHCKGFIKFFITLFISLLLPICLFIMTMFFFNFLNMFKIGALKPKSTHSNISELLLTTLSLGYGIHLSVSISVSVQFSSVQFSHSVVSSSLWPMNRSTPGLPVHHHFPEFTQTHVHRVSDAIQSSHPLSSASPPALNPSQHQSLFQWVNSSHEVAKVLEFQL